MNTKKITICCIVAVAMTGAWMGFSIWRHQSSPDEVASQPLLTETDQSAELGQATPVAADEPAAEVLSEPDRSTRMPRSIWTPDNSLNLAYFSERGVNDTDLQEISDAFIALKFSVINVEMKSAKITPGEGNSVIIEIPRYEEVGRKLYDGFLNKINTVLGQSNIAEISRSEAYGLFGELPNLGLQRKEYILKPVDYLPGGEIARLEVTTKRYRLFQSSITNEISEVKVYQETESDVATSDLDRFGISLSSLFQVADSVLRG